MERGADGGPEYSDHGKSTAGPPGVARAIECSAEIWIVPLQENVPHDQRHRQRRGSARGLPNSTCRVRNCHTRHFLSHSLDSLSSFTYPEVFT